MAAIAQETEEEQRLREEQEALLEMQQLLASRIAPPDIQDAPPAPAIPFIEDAMAAPELPPSVGVETPYAQPGIQERLSTGDYTIDSPRYAAELARAQRGNGFLNADMGPAGNTIVAGYDPVIAEAGQRRQEAQAAQQAKRFTGVQKFQSLIKNGATREEAFALAGTDMFYNDPEAYRAQVLKPPAVVRQPVYKPQWGKMTPAVRAQESNVVGEITALRQQLNRGAIGELLMKPGEADAIRAQIAAKEQQRVQLVDRPEFNPNVDQTGIDLNRWNNPPARPSAQPVQSVKGADEQVVVVKDGRRYSLPKSQLDEALKEGYKRAQ